MILWGNGVLQIFSKEEFLQQLDTVVVRHEALNNKIFARTL